MWHRVSKALYTYTGYKTLASPLLLLFRAQRALWRVAASFWLGMVVVCRTFLILTKGNCFQKDIKGSNVENTVRKSARDISGLLCYCCGKFLGYYSTLAEKCLSTLVVVLGPLMLIKSWKLASFKCVLS